METSSTDTLDRLQQIFNEIQICNSKTFTENLGAALSIIPTDSSFLRIVDTILVHQASIPARIVHFIKRVFEELNETRKEIIIALIAYLLEKSSCKSTKVRKNALRLMHTILSIQGDYCDCDLLAKIAEKLFDKEPSVRKEALKICIEFQHQHLNDSLTIQTTIKDIVRYDASHEIRKIGFLGLEISASTLNCILERCIDSNVSIRKVFWEKYFHKIDLTKLTHPQRIYLMKRGINERSFNAKEMFLEKIRCYGLDQFIEDFYCEDREYEICIEEYLKYNTEQYEMSKYTPSYLYFLCCYYRITEEIHGRDALKLLPLDEFLQIFYLKCVDLEKIMAESEKSTNEMRVLRYFLKILAFYDLFTSESKKYVISITDHIILKCNFVQLVDDCISLLVKTCSDSITKAAGRLIKKTRGKSICFTVCEAVMRYLPYGEIHEAILSEIAILDIEKSSNIFFWYFIKNPNPNIETQYLSLLPSKKVVEGCADLALLGLLDVSKIKDCLLVQLTRFNQNVVIPVCKLLLGNKLDSVEAVKYLFLIYYSTDIESIQQYLSLFFYEYFRLNLQPLLDVFCDVMNLISSNHRVFVDQSLFWISNSEYPSKYQAIYLKVCIFIHNNYDALTNRKYYFSVLSGITADSSWDPIMSKKIIIVLGLIIRKRPRENIHLLLNQVLEIDDGVPLSSDEFGKLQQSINVQT